jgi:hypothetical protein
LLNHSLTFSSGPDASTLARRNHARTCPTPAASPNLNIAIIVEIMTPVY